MAFVIYKTSFLKKLEYKKRFFGDDINWGRYNNCIDKNAVNISVNKSIIENHITLGFATTALQLHIFFIWVLSNIVLIDRCFIVWYL